MRLLFYISLFVLGFRPQVGHSQTTNYPLKAYEFYQKKDFVTAKIWIDSALQFNQIKTDKVWFIRGLIYRELESTTENNTRLVALVSLSKAKNLSTDAALLKQINIVTQNTVMKTYNESIDLLKMGELNKSEARYLKYKEQYLMYNNPTYNFDQLDIMYFNSLGSAWQANNELASFTEQEKQLNIAVEKFQKTLHIDPENYDANYNIGVAYYNLGTDIIIHLDPLSPLDRIEELQITALRLYKNGLPFLMKAYELDPENPQVIEGLRNIHHAMQDEEKEKFFKLLYEQVTGKKLEND
ncbi:hypothetical protein DNU06_13330 [Putridiphycobacter roseus]|uniref:Uncharacterized protein n=1 Tax=Putridiphycobacter roseus TaxID=2219161 RepID=A0A2W1MYJ7_9FLAO|nr:tetratricopeptide repeat protein [Putridiphycobacter roseus]PZE16290.1 hypothetical protein DNU06_13330 [Putridiphycobacter roseus]